MGNQQGKQNNYHHGGKTKKNVHWKTAERPSPPGRPQLIPLSDQQPDVITLKWDRSQSDGGSPILGFIVEHRRMGSPHWVRATPALVIRCEVSISGLEPGWRYQFRTIAENVVGKSEPSELSDPLTVTLQRNAITVPRFMYELKDTNAVENERVELRVSVLGQPQPEISWFKDGFEIFSSRRTKIVNDNDVSVLIIHQVSLTDEGEIKCTATNRAGHVVTRAKLKVEAPPKIRLPRNYEDGLIVEAEEVLRLKVGIAGQPIPNVIWSHEGDIIKNGGRFELNTNEKNSSLKIDNVKREDRGEYHLRAVNTLGEDVASFLVTVTAKPKPPGKIVLNMSFGKSATLSWTAPSDDGGCKIGNYIVEYFRIGWNVWLKAATTRKLTATLHDLIEGSEYKFRVKAENPYGLSDPSDESDVLFIPDPKRGINKPEDRELSPAPDRPIPPKRKTLSPTRNLLGVVGKSPDASREVSPNRQASTPKPELYESEQLNREMSYGTPNDVVNGNIRRSSSGGKTDNLKVDTRNSLSPVKIDEDDMSKSSPSLSRRGSFKLEVTQKIQQFFKRSPSPARKILLMQKEESSVTVVDSAYKNEQSPREASPALLSNQGQLSPKERSPAPNLNVGQLSPKERSPTTDLKKGQISPKEISPTRSYNPRNGNETVKSRSPSPYSRPMESPSSPANLRKSPGLERSQEPVAINENKNQRQKYNRNTITIKKVSPAKTLTINENMPVKHMVINENIPVKQNAATLTNPTIEISAPVNELPGPFDSGKRDEVHTSNEFMLVLYPNKKSNNNEKNESFDLDLEDALLPPPISLSAPDLTDADQYLMSFQLRRSVSSTELLYEKAMARFYEAVELEESGKSKKKLLSKDQLTVGSTTIRKKLGTMTEAERLSFERRNSRRRSADISQEFTINNKWDSKENLASLKLAQKEIEDKIKQIESEEYIEEHEKVKPSKRGSLEYDSDYSESTASDSGESMEKFKTELMARTKSTSGELETYYPRRLSEGNFSPYRSPTPDQSSVVLTRPHPLPSPDFIPKPILKRSSNESVVKDDSGSDSNRNIVANTITNNVADNNTNNVTNITKVKANGNSHGDGNGNGKNLPLESNKNKIQDNRDVNNKEEKKSKGFKSFFKRDKNSDSAKAKTASKSDGNLNVNEYIDKKPITNKIVHSQKSIEEAEKKKIMQKNAEEEAKVVIDHYSDIVKELGRTKVSSIPLYLNSEELRRAAERADLEERKFNLDENIDAEEAELIARSRARPRMSIVERLQSQHVQNKSRSALEKPMNEKLESQIYEDNENEENPIVKREEPVTEKRGRTKIIKKIIKKRIPSATRSREEMETKSQSDIKDKNTEEIDMTKTNKTEFSENTGIRRRQISKTRVRNDSKSPVPFNRRPLKIDSNISESKPEFSTEFSTNPIDHEDVKSKSADEIAEMAQENVRSAVSYMTDLGLFIVACWVYIFKDARLVLPILALMVYRQIGEAISNQIPDWMKRKKS